MKREGFVCGFEGILNLYINFTNILNLDYKLGTKQIL